MKCPEPAPETGKGLRPRTSLPGGPAAFPAFPRPATLPHPQPLGAPSTPTLPYPHPAPRLSRIRAPRRPRRPCGWSAKGPQPARPPRVCRSFCKPIGARPTARLAPWLNPVRSARFYRNGVRSEPWVPSAPRRGCGRHLLPTPGVATERGWKDRRTNARDPEVLQPRTYSTRVRASSLPALPRAVPAASMLRPPVSLTTSALGPSFLPRYRLSV